MVFSKLWVHGFRGLTDQQISLGSRLNVIHGDNASGKTSVVESLDLISRGRSFRTNQFSDIALWSGTGQWSVGATRRLDSGDESLRVQFTKDGLACSVLGRPVTREHLARNAPSLVLGPDLHRLADRGPAERRTFVDWALFHVEHSYVHVWRRFNAALRQRNASLRNGASLAEVAAWNPALVQQGELMDAARRRWIDRMSPTFSEVASRMALLPDVSLFYQPGWSSSLTLAEALNRATDQRGRGGTTTVGPHRGDLQFIARDGKVTAGLSRGQQKIYLLCLAYAVVLTVGQLIGRWPLLVVDDWHSELSEDTAQHVWALVCQYPGQVVLTGFTAPSTAVPAHTRVFHVEQGKIHEC